MTRILAIGDPHGDLKEIKKLDLRKIDVILLTGDLGSANLARKFFFQNIERVKDGLPKIEKTPKIAKEMYLEIHRSTISLLKYLSKFADVYTIEGNVGIYTPKQAKEESKQIGLRLPSTLKEISKLKKVHLVKNQKRNLNNLKIGFLEYFVDTSWVKEFKPTDYSKSLKNSKKETKKALSILKNFGKIDILICHQPPYGFLDKVTAKYAPKNWQGKKAGSKAILDYIKKYQPRYVFCGHIHEGKGYTTLGTSKIFNLGTAGHKILEI